jgi:hypothetical protein
MYKFHPGKFAALLPKLHLNRHTPRAVHFGSLTLGGMALWDQYVNQGYEQLKSFTGHLKLNNEVGQQVLILLSYIQLLSSSSSPILQQSFHLFDSWLEPTWISSIRHLLADASMTLQVGLQWVPTPPCKGNITLMDAAIKFKLAPSVI